MKVDYEGVRFYGYYDKASQTFIQFFPSKNDLTAQRQSKEYCNRFIESNEIFCRDIETFYLFTINENDGSIIESDKKLIFSFNDWINDEREKEKVCQK